MSSVKVVNMYTHIYELLTIANVICVLFCSLKIKQNRTENQTRIKLLRKLQLEHNALKRERVLTDAAVKRAKACKFE